MANILILGAGVMGSAIAVPAADNGHAVRLFGTHLDEAIIATLAKAGPHPRLGVALPPSIDPLPLGALGGAHGDWADVVIVGVSSPGFDWTVDRLAGILGTPKPIALVTKGLVDRGEGPPATYAQALPAALAGHGAPACPFVGIGGPCIARELALRQPTAVVYTATGDAAADVAALMRTPYYRIATSDDPIGVEACAALKNFFAIGVSTALTRYRDTERGEAFKNPVALLFQQAVDEMATLAAWIGGRRETAFGLAGTGDLHVTVGGGRNARLGALLGENKTVSSALDGPLADETIEGVDTGRVLHAALKRASADSPAGTAGLPLTDAILAAIAEDATFAFASGAVTV